HASVQARAKLRGDVRHRGWPAVHQVIAPEAGWQALWQWPLVVALRQKVRLGAVATDALCLTSARWREASLGVVADGLAGAWIDGQTSFYCSSAVAAIHRADFLARSCA